MTRTWLIALALMSPASHGEGERCQASRIELDREYEVLRHSEDPALRSIAASLSAPVIETRAIVAAEASDCYGRRRTDVEIEVWTGERLHGVHSNPAWLILASGHARFVARELDTGRAFAVLGPVAVRPGFMRVVLTPRRLAVASK